MCKLLEVLNNVEHLEVEEKKKAIVKNMIERGQQVPLNKLFPPHIIKKLIVKKHVLIRYKQRFEKLYDIEIENMIKKDLISHAMVVDKGHSDRWIVHMKGMILVLDEHAIYTTYDANGKNKKNIINPTLEKLKKIEKKSKRVERLNYLFDLINKKEVIPL